MNAIMKEIQSHFVLVLLFLLIQPTWLRGQVVERQVIAAFGYESVEMSATCGDLLTTTQNDSLTNGFQQPMIPLNTGNILTRSLSSVKIFPNPNRGSFRIESSRTGQMTLSIFDMRGRLLLDQIVFPGEQVQVDLPPATYAVSVRTERELLTERLVITP